MDPRVTRHAEILASWCLDVREGDHVLVDVDEGGETLADAVVVEVAKRGGQPIVLHNTGAAERGFLVHATEAALEAEPAHLRALVEASDKVLAIMAGRNTRDLADVPGERVSARRKAMAGIRETRLTKRWCLTLHPTDALAQEAGMATPAFAELFYNATLVDWKAFAEKVRKVADRMEGTREIHLVAPDTDLYLPVRDRVWIASTGERNMPSGEAFTAPLENAVEGHVVLDLPAVVQGTEVRGIRLVFEKGEVVDWSAERGAEAVADLLDTDAGAKRLGELGIGMNRGIDRPTRNILLDEKMGGTVHLALGRSYKECKGENGSAIHQDLIKTMPKGSYIAADGDVVQRDGWFWFEQGFRRSS